MQEKGEVRKTEQGRPEKASHDEGLLTVMSQNISKKLVLLPFSLICGKLSPTCQSKNLKNIYQKELENKEEQTSGGIYYEAPKNKESAVQCSFFK
ncbi:MAG: hypothetical protein ACHQ6U_04890 [Thermodesulfobacteriota bacterium]